MDVCGRGFGCTLTCTCVKNGVLWLVVFLCVWGFCLFWFVRWLYRVFSELLASRSIICTLPCTDSHLLFDLTSVVLFWFVFFVWTLPRFVFFTCDAFVELMFGFCMLSRRSRVYCAFINGVR